MEKTALCKEVALSLVGSIGFAVITVPDQNKADNDEIKARLMTEYICETTAMFLPLAVRIKAYRRYNLVVALLTNFLLSQMVTGKAPNAQALEEPFCKLIAIGFDDIFEVVA